MCTAIVIEKKLYVAWLGDSQAMMIKAGANVDLMNPHKPNRDDEKQRIEAAGGVVVWFACAFHDYSRSLYPALPRYGAWRVNGVLSVARAIGDRKLKQWVIGNPDVNTFDLDGTEDYLIIGCDGLWDVMTPDKVFAVSVAIIWLTRLQVIDLIGKWKSIPENNGIKVSFDPTFG